MTEYVLGCITGGVIGAALVAVMAMYQIDCVKHQEYSAAFARDAMRGPVFETFVDAVNGNVSTKDEAPKKVR
jgi:hypothetical protein